jgi:dipeptidyl aminopeptidase/acylaminoacyl peptidase
MLPKYANLISHIPAYIVHGELDKEVNIMESLEISEALNKVGGKVKLKILPEVGHEVCTNFIESN